MEDEVEKTAEMALLAVEKEFDFEQLAIKEE